MDIRIFAPESMLETEINLPLSKSMSNRALILNALTEGAPEIERVADCDDTAAMKSALASLPASGLKEINIQGAGTAMRFLTAYYAATPGAEVILDGNERMRQRPIGELVEALKTLGAEIEYAGTDGFPPLHIKGKKLDGGRIDIDATVSSQFVSALLMVAPTMHKGLTLTLKGEPSSLPYITMTIEMMRHRGIDIEMDFNEIMVRPGRYSVLPESDIEPDWSAASYWYSIAALSAGWVTLPGLKLPSLQGDSRIAQIFEKLGVITNEAEEGDGLELSASPEVFSRLDEDLSDCPDVVQTLVVACCMLGVPFRFSGVSSLKIKETDRLDALCKEAIKVGCVVEVDRDDTIKWDGKRVRVTELPEIDTYGDHRMAMAFAPAALYLSGMIIKDHSVVSKSYPDFWKDMLHAGFVFADAAVPLPTDPNE